MSKEPLWQAISTQLRSRLRSGEYETHQFPGELELAQEFEVSRGTIRAALDPLRREGLVRAARGRRPVAARPLEQTKPTSRFGAIYSLEEIISEAGMTHAAQVLSRSVVENHEAAQMFELPQSTLFFELVRLRLANEEPVAHEAIYVPASIAETLVNADFTESAFYEQLRTYAGIEITCGYENLRAVMGSATLRDVLATPEDQPLLLVERLACTEDGIVEYRKTHFVGDKFTAYRPFGTSAISHS